MPAGTSSVARLRAYRDRILNMTAVVYTSTLATGKFTTVAIAALPCRLNPLSAPGVPSNVQRVELTSERELLWGDAVTLPAVCELQIGADRWNVVKGTEVADTWTTTDEVIQQRCRVVKVGT